jgi:V8-like Glu-specific endopeptidase
MDASRWPLKQTQSPLFAPDVAPQPTNTLGKRVLPLQVWHNYGFDRHVLANMGIHCAGFGGDTLHMARLHDASRKLQGGYSLESLSSDQQVAVLGGVSLALVSGLMRGRIVSTSCVYAAFWGPAFFPPTAWLEPT